jgi:hypothetical protein
LDSAILEMFEFIKLVSLWLISFFICRTCVWHSKCEVFAYKKINVISSILLAWEWEVSVLETHTDLHLASAVSCTLAVPWPRQSVTGLLPRRPGFAPWSVHVGFVVDRVASGQVFLWVLQHFPVSIISA